MANSLAGLNLTAIAQETLPVLQKYTPRFTLFTSDFSSDVAVVGSAVSTRIPTAMTAVAYTRAGGYAVGNSTSSAVTVTLDQHVHYTVGLDDSEIGNAGLAKLQNTFIQPAVYAIVNAVQTTLYGLISTAYPSVYSASYANFGFLGLTTAGKVLDNSGSMAPRCAILGTNLYYDVLDDVKAVSVVGADSIIRAGNIGELAGMTVALSPSTTFAGTGLAGFVAGKDAIAMAARLPSIPGSFPGEVANVVDPDSNYAIQLRQWYSPDDGMWKISAISIYGASRANTSSGVRVLTTD